jgi:hypothetical protein
VKQPGTRREGGPLGCRADQSADGSTKRADRRSDAPSIAEDVGANDTGVHAGDLDAGVPPPFGELDGEQVVRELRAARDPQTGPVPPVLQVVEVQGVAVLARVGDKDDAAAGRGAQQVIRTSHEEESATARPGALRPAGGPGPNARGPGAAGADWPAGRHRERGHSRGSTTR